MSDANVPPDALPRPGTRGKCALVTGGTGFTGAYLVRSLTSDGYAVRVVTRSAERARTVFGASTNSVDVLEGDLRDAAIARRAVSGCDEVYHLAAAFREPGIRPRQYREVHVAATRYLLEASRAEHVSRFVHCSTVGVHSDVVNPPADENEPHHPGDIYQETKSEGELLALRFQQEHGFPLTVARPVGIYGPGDMRMLKLFRAIARRRFVMIGSGRTLFHMVHVRDLVRGLRLMAEHDAAIGEVFILGGEEYCSLRELVARIANVWSVPQPSLRVPVWPVYAAGAVCEALCVPFGIDPPLYRRRVSFFTKNRAFRIDKARRVLGYRPAVGLQQGLEETAAWYRDNGYI